MIMCRSGHEVLEGRYCQTSCQSWIISTTGYNQHFKPSTTNARMKITIPSKKITNEFSVRTQQWNQW